MRKIKAAFYVFINSLVSPKYYQDTLTVNFRFSLKYFAFIALMASLITFPSLVGPTTNEIKTELLSLKENIIKAYPKTLEITLKGGNLTLNQDEPYIFAMPKQENILESETKTIENLIVLDVNGTLDDLERYNTLILVNKSNILIKDENKIEVYPLKNFPDGVINAESLLQIFEEINPIMDAIPYLVMILAFLGSIFYYFGFRMFYLLFVALALMVVGQIRGLNLNFGKYYQIGIHAISLPLLIEVVTSVTNYQLTYPHWFFVLNILMGFLVVVSFDKTDIDTNK